MRTRWVVSAFCAGALLVLPASSFGASADLAYTASSSAPQSAEEGPTFTHSTTVVNNGPDDVTVTIRVTTNPMPFESLDITQSTETIPSGAIDPDPNNHFFRLHDFTLRSGKTVKLVVTIAPSDRTLQTTTGTVEASNGSDPNPGNESASATTSVTGLAISPTSFGDQLLGTTGDPHAVAVTNGSAQSVQLTSGSVGISGPDFTLANLGSCAGPIAPGASCGLNARFAPTAAGDRSAALTLAPSGGLVDPASGILFGRGVPAVTPPDTAAPVVTVARLPRKITLKKLRRTGIRFSESANEPAAFTNDLLGTPRSATLRRVRAKSYSLVLAHTTRPLGTGARTVTLKPSGRLIGKAKHFRLRLVVAATDASGNRRTTTKTISVR